MTRGLNTSLGTTVVTAILAGIAGVAGSYALARYTQAFIAAPIATFLIQHMLDVVLRFAIEPLIGCEHSVLFTRVCRL